LGVLAIREHGAMDGCAGIEQVRAQELGMLDDSE